MNSGWFVYILRTNAGSLYTGITTDVCRRIDEHLGKLRGAKSLRGKGPLELVWKLQVEGRSKASIIESRIKKLQRKDKGKLITGDTEILNKILP